MSESFIPPEDRVDVIGRLNGRLEDAGSQTLRERAAYEAGIGADSADADKPVEVLKPVKDENEKDDVKEGAKDGKEEPKDGKEQKDEPKDDKEPKEDKEFKDGKEEKEPKEDKEDKEGPKDDKEPKEDKELKEVKDADEKDGVGKEHGEKEATFEGPAGDEQGDDRPVGSDNASTSGPPAPPQM